MTREQIRDVTKEARRKLRQRRSSCEHYWEEHGRRKNQYERCSYCGARFPCADNDCEHFDCAQIQIKRGLRVDWPDHSTITISEDNEVAVLFDNTEEVYEHPKLFKEDFEL